jgi:hypothetical protein
MDHPWVDLLLKFSMTWGIYLTNVTRTLMYPKV